MPGAPAFCDHLDPRLELGQDRVSRGGRGIGALRGPGERVDAARGALKPLLTQGIAAVVPGFIGRTPDGHVATLGRGGSDLTATLLGRALRATSITLWKDVPGLLTADPNIVPDARVIPQLTPREAAELAYYGAKILHPRALIPLGDRPIPIFVRPFADPAADGVILLSGVPTGDAVLMFL